MRTDTKYLDVSKNGWFSYCRRIPSSLKGSIEFARYENFYTKAFKTKDRVLAELETERLNKWFEKLLDKSPQPRTTKDKVRRIKDELRIRDLLSQSVPVGEISAYVADQSTDVAFGRKLAEMTSALRSDWGSVVEIDVEPPALKSKFYSREMRREEEIERLTDYIADKYDDGNGGYLKINPYDEDVIRLKILQGQFADVPLEPTFGDAVEFYLVNYAENKRTNENQRHHYLSQIKSIANKLASGLDGGLDTPLSQLDRDEIKQIAERVWPNPSTRNTNLSGRMVSVITTWNRLNPKHSLDLNPFSSLVGDKVLHEGTKDRRSATPDELKTFWSNLEAVDVDPEIRIIGMMMAYTGCPQGEVAGMLRRDLKLKTSVPHVIIRNNKLRILAKKRLERCIPLVGKILEYWRAYEAEHFRGDVNAPLFPKFGQGLHQVSARAKKLSKLVANIEGGEALFSAYSMRHSFKDRYKAAGVPAEIGEYLFGHITAASSRVHAAYGGFEQPERFVDYMLKINAAQDSFGYQEHFDD